MVLPYSAHVLCTYLFFHTEFKKCGRSVGWATDSWFRGRSWSQGGEMEAVSRSELSSESGFGCSPSAPPPLAHALALSLSKNKSLKNEPKSWTLIKLIMFTVLCRTLSSDSGFYRGTLPWITPRHLHFLLALVFAPLVQMSTQWKRQINHSIVKKMVLIRQTPERFSGIPRGSRTTLWEPLGVCRYGHHSSLSLQLLVFEIYLLL